MALEVVFTPDLDAPVRSYGVVDIAGGLGLTQDVGQPHLGGVASDVLQASASARVSPSASLVS